MTHPSEEELIAYREGGVAESEAMAEHLRECDECRAGFARLDEELTAMFAALDTLKVPDPGGDYGQRVWKDIAPKLQPQRGSASIAGDRVRWWQGHFAGQLFAGQLLAPRRLAAFAGVAALVVDGGGLA